MTYLRRNYFSSPPRWIRLLAMVATLLLGMLASTSAVAQTTGSIDGFVMDGDGLGIPGATVTLTSPQILGGKQEQSTDVEGYFRFTALIPGLYQITVSKANFRTVSAQGIQVTANHTFRQDVVLQLGDVGDVVDVVAQQTVDTESTTIGRVLTKDFLQKVPTGRSYQQAVQAAAGVTGGANPNMAGGAANENQYLLDGANITDPVTGTFGLNFNYDAIQSIEVWLGGYDAEYNTIGGIINLVTESGSNNLSFDTSAYYRNGDWSPRMDARFTADGNPLGPTSFAQTFQTYNINAKVSGPLVREKAFFLFSYAHERSLIALSGIPQRRDYDGHYLLGKLTIQPNPQHRLTISAQTDPASIDNISQGNAFQKDESQGQQSQGGFVAQLKWDWFVDEHWNIETRAQVQKVTIEQNAVPCTHDRTVDRHNCRPGEPEGFVDYYTSGRFGAFGAYDSVNWGQLYLDDRWRFNASSKVSVLAVKDPSGGTHDIKFGVEGNQFLNSNVQAFSGNGYAVDINESLFNPETFINYYWVESTGPIYQRNTGSNWDIFLQDVYKPVSNFTLRMGARVDSTLLRNDVGDPVVNNSMFSPRLYAAWDPFKDQRTRIGGGYGRFADSGRQSIADFTNQGRFGYKLYLGELFGGSMVGDPGDIADQVPQRNLNTANPSLRLPTADEFVFQFERQIVQDLRFGTAATARFTRHIYEPDDQNLVWDEDGSAIIGSQRLDPFNYYFRLRTPREARRNYYRVDAYLIKNQARRWYASLNYSYEFMNGTSEQALVGAFINDPQTRYNYGQMLTVVSHDVSASGFWDVPNDPWTTTIGFFFRYESGAPLERLYWGDQSVTNGSFDLRIRPRSYYWRFNSFWELSLSIEQKFNVRKGQLSLHLIAYNITNNRAPVGLSSSLYTLNRLLPVTRQNPASLQLGVTYEF